MYLNFRILIYVSDLDFNSYNTFVWSFLLFVSTKQMNLFFDKLPGVFTNESFLDDHFSSCITLFVCFPSFRFSISK